MFSRDPAAPCFFPAPFLTYFFGEWHPAEARWTTMRTGSVDCTPSPLPTECCSLHREHYKDGPIDSRIHTAFSSGADATACHGWLVCATVGHLHFCMDGMTVCESTKLPQVTRRNAAHDAPERRPSRPLDVVEGAGCSYWSIWGLRGTTS